MTERTTTAASYGTSGVLFAFGTWTLNDWALAIGALCGLITVATNAFFQWRRDQREKALTNKQLGL